MNICKKSLAWTCFALAAAIFSAIVFLQPIAPPALREVPASELALRDGHSYWKHEATPFSGAMLEQYPDGSRKSRSVLSNGVMHGVSEGWFSNGHLQIREHFHHGLSHGLREKWFASGAKMSEATIEAGKMEGVFKRWHEAGTMAEEVRMKNGNPDGLSTAYYSNGTLKARVTLKNGKVIEQEFWENGEEKQTHASSTIAGVPGL